MENKTCILKVEGFMHSTHLDKDIFFDTITDKDALYLLSKNVLREKHFKVLPESYIAIGVIYSKKELNEALKRNSTKELNSIVKDLKLSKGNVKLSMSIQLIKKYKK